MQKTRCERVVIQIPGEHFQVDEQRKQERKRSHSFGKEFSVGNFGEHILQYVVDNLRERFENGSSDFREYFFPVFIQE